MKTYEAEVTRDDGVWAVVVHGLPPHTIGATDVERFGDLTGEVRDLIAGLTQTDLDSFDITWRIVIDGHDVTREIAWFAHASDELQKASSAWEAARKRLMEALANANLSQAAIGDVLGVSHQRVGQLMAGRR